MWGLTHFGRRVGAAFAALVAISLTGPAASSAVEVKTSQVEINTVFLTAERSFANEVGITWVTSPNGTPDLVIGDTKGGIPDPIPTQCVRVDPTIVRCDAQFFTALDALLGPGPDSITVVPAVSVNGFISMKLDLGPGRDRASDEGQTRDVWNGGSGRDRLSSGPLNDRVKGGPQNDSIDCGAGHHDVGIGGPGPLDLGIHCEVVKH